MMRHHFFSAASRLSVSLVLLASLVVGQETRASLSGTITDPSGSSIARASLLLVNVDTGVENRTETNVVGQYRFLFVNPGTYRMTAEMQGFRKAIRENIILSTGQAATLDMGMQLGTQAESVTVSSEAALIEAEKADRGMVVVRQNVAELPIMTRTPLLLATLAPGVTNSSSRYDWTPFSNSGLTTWSINGSTAFSTGFLIDGAPNDVVYQSAPSVAYVPPSDAVQEFRVVANAYDAQFGRNGGGIISMVTKNGTNQLHGTAYYYLKRPSLNATSFSNNAKGLGPDDTPLDQYGFTVGGPVHIPKLYTGRDRTFFFFAWEKYKQNQVFPQNDVSSVPTLAQRRGDFSETLNSAGRLITIYDPNTGRSVNGQWVRDPFPNNIIPANRIDPTGAKIVSLYPEPNLTTTGSSNWQNNYFLKDNTTWYDFYNVVTRIDHSFGEKERISGRYVTNDMNMFSNTNGMPGAPADRREGHKINHGFVFDSLTLLSPTSTLDLRASVTRWVQDYKPTNWGEFDASVIGWPQSLVGQLQEPNRFPRITFANYKALGSSASNIWLAATTTLALAPTFTKVQGRHNFKVGLDYRWTRYANYQSAFSGGTFAFDGGFTRSNYLAQDALSGNSVASALLGYAASGSVDFIARPFYRWHYIAPFMQDDIKLNRRLTINVGLRWDVQLPVTEKFSQMNHGFFTDQVNPISARVNQTAFPGFNVNGGIGFVGRDGLPASPYLRDSNNIQPRLGAAFQLTPKTVLRGGWGLSYMNNVSTGSSFGFSQNTPYVASVDAGRTSASVVSNPFPSGVLPPTGASLGMETMLGRGPDFADSTGNLGYVHSFSFGIQRQLPGLINLDVSYVGSRTVAAGTTKPFNALSVENLALGDITQGGNPSFLTGQVPNPFAGLIPGTGLNNATVPRQQLLLPYPQFTAFSMQDYNVGKVWYNALQITLQKRYSHGLILTATYALSKNLQALNYLNPQDPLPSRSLTPFDRPNRLTLAPIYELPFGRGRRFLSQSNGVVSRLVGGWLVVMNTTFMSGVPMTVPNNVFLLRDPSLANPTWDRMFNTGTIQLNGQIVNPAGDLPPAFQIQPAFTLRTASQYFPNLRNRWGNEYNVSFVKKTAIREGMQAQFRAEVFNLTNHPIFPNNPVLDTSSPNFGKLIRDNGQTNVPRQIQLGLRFEF
jgi:hypothetical protein